MSKTLSVIVPCYNEEGGLNSFFERLYGVLEGDELSSYRHEVIAINDGSRDRTLEELLEAKKRFKSLRILDLSRNYGKEAALTAGLNHATGDAVIPIDADLQHPPELLIKMVALWESGYEVVVAKRMSRDTDRPVQRAMAKAFYRMHNAISDIEVPEDVGDFRLMDRVVVEALRKLPENRRFMKGLFAWVGFRTSVVEYQVEARLTGSSKFNSWKLWNFALEGITSFSNVPLRIWTYLGFLIAMSALVYGIYVIVKTMVFGVDLPGYPSLLVSVLFLGGVQLISIGVLGEYIGRIYLETKQRPVYLVRKEY